MKYVLKSLLELIYPVRCALCGRGGQLICPDCFQSLNLIGSKICLKCGKPSHYVVDECRECRDAGFVFIQSRALGLYEDHLKELIHRLKYNNCRGLAEIFAGLLINRLEPGFFALDLITSVPMSKEKQIQRGFNQAQLFGRQLSVQSDKPFKEMLLLRRETKDQSKLEASERAKNVKGAFALKPGMTLDGLNILLVDDVFTTGSTVNECSKALIDAGAQSVKVATIARSTYLV
jgi:competence protein ComFC